MKKSSFSQLLQNYRGGDGQSGSPGIGNEKGTRGEKRKIEETKETKETEDTKEGNEVKEEEMHKKQKRQTENVYGKMYLKFLHSSLSMDLSEVCRNLFTSFFQIRQEDYRRSQFTIHTEKFTYREGILEISLNNKEIFLYLLQMFVLQGNYRQTGVEITLRRIERFDEMLSLSPLPLPSLSRSIVVARYQESVAWIPPDWHSSLFFYDKSNPDNPSLPANQTVRHLDYHHYERLPNLGRESHTYLHHIIQNYETLTDVIYLTQANPFDHSPQLIQWINLGIGGIEEYFPLGNRLLTIYSCNVRQYEKNFPGIQEGLERTFRRLFEYSQLTSIAIDREDIGKKDSRERPFPNKIIFSPGAILSVTRNCIHQRPKSFYENAIKILDYDKNPIEGHAFERLWSLIFSSFPNE